MVKPPCNCGKPTKKPTPKTTNDLLVKCTNCTGPLVTLHGSTVPVHSIELLVSPTQILAWESEGYTFSKRAP